MNAERWRQAREIFDVALETAPGERDAYLTTACGADRDLRDTVDRLLTDASAGDTSWLEDGAAEGLVRRALERRSLEGQRIGDFVIHGVLGSGGMATVFEAEQQHPTRSVALKVMRFGLLSETARRRFEYESEVLAGLRHPGIAQVYATGTYDDGMSGQELPYFAMELVEGARTLNTYVREETCDLRSTLGLFLTICQAVHYGHQRGFIHRDLKPQNILVDERGRPKIIDFGIARATGPGTGEQTLYTQQGEILGTLHYMSPEQIDPDDSGLDIRCDVYALGVILFELLAGRLPFDLEGKLITTVATVIMHQEPPLPSSLGSRFSRASQSEDLDWVILKAMDKDRTRRYASAAELAADVDRILADEPVLARPRTRLYLTKKFIKRHRLAVSAAAIVLVSLIAGITMTSIGMRRARVAEQEARASEEVANEALAAAEIEIGTHKAVNDFLGQMFTSANPYEDGRDVRVIDVLDRASERIDELYGDRPQWAAAVASQLGSTYFSLGQHDKGTDHFERAVAISREHLDPQHHVTLTSLHNLGTGYLGLSRIEEAEALLTEALEGRVQVFGPESREAADTMMVLAQLAYNKNELDTAVSRFEEARGIFLEILGPASRPAVQTTAGLGVVLNALGRLVEAEEMYRWAIDHGEPELGSEHPSVLSARMNLAQNLSDQGALEEAAEMLQAVFEAEERVVGPNHDRTLTTLNNLASTLLRQGREHEAEEKYRDLIARRRAAGDDMAFVTAAALNNLGVCLERQDRLEEAEASIAEALELLGQLQVPDGHWLTAAFRKAMAVVRIKQQRYDEAETTLKQSIAVFEVAQGDQQRRIQAALEALVTLYEAWDKPELAQQTRERLLIR